MRALGYLFVLISLIAAPLWAQDADTAARDKSFLENWLEENLSDAGRDVVITGFEGALSTRATMQSMTMADDDGVWLRLEGVALDWDRTAILKRRLIVQDLSVELIEVIRPPLSSSGPRSTASGFSLPQLPVAIDLNQLKADRVVLGETVLGEKAELTLEGVAALENGEGGVDLRAQRIDGPQGALTLKGAFSNDSGQLSIDLSLTEGKGGIAAGLLGMPGAPALDLALRGDGLISDFTAEMSLATNDIDRLAGTVSLALPEGEAARFGVDVTGDVSALFAPEYQAFFGTDTALVAQGRRFENGTFQLTKLDLSSQQLNVTGRATLNARGWAERAAFTVTIQAEDGGTVTLPLSGAPTEIDSLTASFDYDVSRGEKWTGAARLEGLSQAGSRLGELGIAGVGKMSPGGADKTPTITGQISILAQDIAPLGVGWAQAIGPRVSGFLRFSKFDNTPGRFSDISLSGADYGLRGNAILSLDPKALDLLAEVDLALSLRDLARFSSLAGREVSGAATLNIAGTAALPGGAVDLKLTGTGRDLSASVAQLDPLFVGQSDVAITLVRDETGTRVDAFEVAARGADLTGSANLAEGEGAVRFTLSVPDASLMDAALQGPLQFDFAADQQARLWEVLANGAGPGEAEITIEASAQRRTGGVGSVTGDVSFSAKDIAPYRGLVGRDLSGAITGEAFVAGDFVSGGFGAIGDIATTGLRLGLGRMDRLVGGQTSASFDLTRREDGAIVLNSLSARTPELTLEAEGRDDAQTALSAAFTLRDLGVIVPGFEGAFSAQGTGVLEGETWRVLGDGAGPGGTTIEARGGLASNFSTADLSLIGAAPLGLANPFIQPRQLSGMARYDLTLRGPLALSSLAGNVEVAQGRASLPILRVALDPISARATITGGKARVDMTAGVSSGGSISVSGPIALTAPFDASLGVFLNGLGITDPVVVDTVVDGRLSLIGPLAGGATIAGALTLGQAELRVPTSGFGSFPEMAGLVHLHEPGAVRQTRAFANMIGKNAAGTGATTVAYPLDISLSAPSRVFLRGRGIDAELGGEIRLGGTTAEIVPQGAFNLIRGRIDFLGKRLTMVEASATLLGSFDPYIRAVAQTNIDDVSIRVVVEGRASEPEITFSSVPDLPQDEILARLVFGRSLADISPLQALQLANGVATLAGAGDGGTTSRLRQGFGLADLDVTTDENGTAAVRAGAYLGENIYTDVTVNAEGEAEVNINLDLTPSLTARGRLSTDGDTGIGIYFEKDY
ncbi:MAG: translocation/assembly module TamB domain-containing protein [Maritimibacter sp.]